MAFAFAYYIVSFLVSLINPFWGLVGFVCSLLLRFQDHYPEVVIIKPFTLLLFGMILGCIINKDSLSTRNWKQDKLLIAMLIISILGLLVLSPGELINETFLFLCALSLYYFTSRIIQTPSQILILFFCMATSITYLGYLAIEDVAINELKSDYVDPRSDRWQGIGYYSNSNEFGQLMITTMPFLLAVLLVKKRILLKLISISMMSILLLVMVKCESRTVMVTLAMMIIGTFMLRGKGNVLKKILVGGVMTSVMLTVLTFMPGPIQERMGTILNASEDESFQGRTRSWDYGFKMLSWYPITGVGKGQWIQYHGLMPHNSYVQIMAELGFFGILVFLWILGLSFKTFKPVFESDLSADPPSHDPSDDDEMLTTEYELDYDSMDSDLFSDGDQEAEPKDSGIDDFSKTIAIAVLMTFCGWLLYIFLGNQGYSVWTYFYIGLCASVANFLAHDEATKQNDIFSD